VLQREAENAGGVCATLPHTSRCGSAVRSFVADVRSSQTLGLDSNYITGRLALEGGGDCRADCFRGPTGGRRIDVAVTFSRGSLLVPKQCADEGQPEACADSDRRTRMPQRMQCDAALEARMLDELAPRPVEITAGCIGLIAGDHKVAEADLREILEYGERRGVEPDRPRTGLAIRQHEQSAFKVDVVPTKGQNFAEPTAGQ